MTIPSPIIASLGMSEVVVIFLVILLLFGGKKMPEVARTFGRVMREFKKASSEIEREIKSAIDDESPLREKEPTPGFNQTDTKEDPYDESIYPELEENYEDLNQPPDISALPDSGDTTPSQQAELNTDSSNKDTMPAPQDSDSKAPSR